MKTRRVIIAFATTFLALAHAQTNGAKTINIGEAVSLALENNISLKREELKLKSAKRQKNSSWNSVSPSVSVGGGISKNNEEFIDNYTAYLQAGISITLGTNIYSDIRGAILSYEAGEMSYENAMRSVEMNVRNAFYYLLYLDENIALQQAALNTARELYETNRRKYNQGAISELDVLSSQVNYENRIPQLQSAQIARENNLALFKQTIGLDQKTDLVLDGNLDQIVELIQAKADEVAADEEMPTFSIEEYLADLDTKNPDILSLEKNMEIAKNTLLASRFSAYGPTITASWNYRPTWQKNKYLQTGPDDRGALSLSINIPLDGLFPWSRSGLAVSNAKSALADLELQLEDKKTEIQVAAFSRAKSIEQLVATLQNLQANVRLAERSYQMTLEAYNRGTRNFTELLSARDSLEAARLNLKQQAYNLTTEILTLENTLGVPFGTLLSN